MNGAAIVVAQCDPRAAEQIAIRLYACFDAVAIARNADELRQLILKRRAVAAIVDLEMLTLGELVALRQEFPSVAFVCTHRVADEEMWTAALDAGACDCCLTHDLDGIVAALRQGPPQAAHSAA
ncbi:MAG TPA: hypothetical protein VNK82_05690 [Terriglobales bacterium]|nr:hypothetical protein [Terriglobales bacterium]